MLRVESSLPQAALSKRRILLRCQIQPNRTTPVGDGVLDCLLVGRGSVCPSAHRHLDDPRRVLEDEFSGERGLEIRLKEADVPSLSPDHEVHVDATSRLTALAVALS